MKLIFNPCGEFRRSPEGPVSQIHSPLLHVGAHGIFSDLLRHVQMRKESGMRKETGSQRTYSIPGKTAALVPEFAEEDLPSSELQPRYLRLHSRTCLGKNTLMMMMMMMMMMMIINSFLEYLHYITTILTLTISTLVHNRELKILLQTSGQCNGAQASIIKNWQIRKR